MPFFGKNVKKIRTIKQLSQQEFGELFDIKRGTLGAYEEGRSMPKVDAIIKIANYFGISIDDMLTKELTVNELLQFKTDFTLQPEELSLEKFAIIPCITEKEQQNYINNFTDAHFISKIPHLSLPLNLEKKFRGLVVSNLEMTNHDKGFYPRDIVIGELVPKAVYEKLNNGTLVFAVTSNDIIFRRLYYSQSKFTLRADHKSIQDITLDKKEIQELWRVRYVFYRRIPEINEGIENKLEALEQQIEEIKGQM